MDLDDYQPLGDDFDMLFDAEPLPQRAAETHAGNLLDGSAVFNGNDEESSDITEEPAPRKKRSAKFLKPDANPELHSANINQWNKNYLQNMATDTKYHQANKAPARAKKNAAFWLYGSGIGRAGRGIGGDGILNPAFAMFHGQKLLEALGVAKVSSAGKRVRIDGEENGDTDGTDEQGRRVKERLDDGEQIGLGDDDMLRLIDDDNVSVTCAREWS